MHLELNPKYKAGLENIIRHMEIDAHLINSFNASGETITLSASRETLERILEASEDDFGFDKDRQEDGYPIVTLEGLKAIIKDYLADRI